MNTLLLSGIVINQSLQDAYSSQKHAAFGHRIHCLDVGIWPPRFERCEKSVMILKHGAECICGRVGDIGSSTGRGNGAGHFGLYCTNYITVVA